MIDPISESVKKRNRQRSIAISDNLIKEIKKLTKDSISVSSFVRFAVSRELERFKKNGWTKNMQ